MDLSLKDRIDRLCSEYEQTWGREVDFTLIPPGITQETLVRALELMIETNDSLLNAYNKVCGRK